MVYFTPLPVPSITFEQPLSYILKSAAYRRLFYPIHVNTAVKVNPLIDM